jgi:outer membrane receptor protein involved in Fe transport
MASYKLNNNWYLQLNGFNLANKLYYGGSYYTSVSENHAIPGAGRSVRLTIRFTL